MSAEQPSNFAPPPTSSATDAELLLALRAGQTAALGELYDRHSSLVYSLALKVLNRPQEAEDLMQDIFLNLAQSTYDPKRGSLRTYLAILTRSRAIDRVRSHNSASRAIERSKPGINQAVNVNSPLEYAFQTEQSQAVQAALAQLSEEQQQVLRMTYYDGLSQSEIARQLALPLGTVKARARRGLVKLRQTLRNS